MNNMAKTEFKQTTWFIQGRSSVCVCVSGEGGGNWVRSTPVLSEVPFSVKNLIQG